jgi:cytosine/adenosine deaminase-related metal-dependent hydrolase
MESHRDLMAKIRRIFEARRSTCQAMPIRQKVRAIRVFSLQPWLRVLLLAIVVAGLAQAGNAQTSVQVGTDAGKFVLRGTIVKADGALNGEMVIDGDTISCVATTCTAPPGATVITITNAYIFPGFIDAHNHVAYNFLPKWNPPKVYQRRAQWQASLSYKAFKKPYDDNKKELFCEMVKYGELKALLSGVTTIQGTSPGSACINVLIRNAENQNQLKLPASYIRTYILGISSFKETIDWKVTKSFVVHIAEGAQGDPASLKEFQILQQKNLLTASTAIIHDTAFGDTEFQKMGQAGAKLIWSPESNLRLYNQTTNIPLALQHGVPVSLGVDWNPSGSDTLFDELRVAGQVNSEVFHNAIPPGDWIKMVTVNPARALALDSQIGDLKQGLKADITVLSANDADPTQSLLKTHLQDVQMVWVGGVLLYGSESILQSLKKDACEPLLVHGSKKRLCVRATSAGVPKSDETLAVITQKLQSAYSGLAPLVP